MEVLELLFDPNANAAYVQVSPLAYGGVEDALQEGGRSTWVDGEGVRLDFDQQGHLLGVYVEDARNRLERPLLARARREVLR